LSNLLPISCLISYVVEHTPPEQTIYRDNLVYHPNV
jgi:hypothetical protein